MYELKLWRKELPLLITIKLPRRLEHKAVFPNVTGHFCFFCPTRKK